MFILHAKRFDMTSWFGFPEYIFCSERDIHLFILFTYLVRRILNIHCKYYVIDTLMETLVTLVLLIPVFVHGYVCLCYSL